MENFKKLFAIDLDGTLLSKTKKIKDKDINALKKYCDNGGEIIIITGKSVSSGLKYVRLIEKKLSIKMKYASFLTGAIIYDLIKNEIISKVKISHENTKKLCDLCFLYKCDFIGVDEIENSEFFVMNKSFLFNQIMKFFYIKKNNFLKIKNTIEFEAYKFNACKKIFWNNNLKKLKYSIEENNSFHVADTHKWFYEITMINANKEKALIDIIKLLNVDLSDTAAIGDSSNDIPMLRIANLSFGIDNKKNEFRKNVDVLYKRRQKNPVSLAIDYMFK